MSIITNVEVTLDPKQTERESNYPICLAYCKITLAGCFVVRDIKVVLNTNGKFIICMPAKKVMDRCPNCKSKNPLDSSYCGQCSTVLPEVDAPLRNLKSGRLSYHSDIAFPITREFRQELDHAVLSAYEKAKLEYVAQVQLASEGVKSGI